MEIYYVKTFRKNFKKRILFDKALEKRYKERLAIFLKNRKEPVLKDHKLIGRLKSFRAFSVTGDIRVIYFEEAREKLVFIDIGTHNQIYS